MLYESISFLMASWTVLSSRLASCRRSQSSCSDTASWQLTFPCGLLSCLTTFDAAVTAQDPLGRLSCFLELYRTSLRVALESDAPGDGAGGADVAAAVPFMPSSFLSLPRSISASFLLIETAAAAALFSQVATLAASRASRTALQVAHVRKIAALFN